MPLIQLTVPEGTLTPEGRRSIQKVLAQLLLSWEGAPDTALFRSVTWSYLYELPAGALVTGEDEAPRYRVDVTVPEGSFSDRRKAGLVGDVTSAVLAAAGLPKTDSMRVWVLVHEQPDGTWGAGGTIVHYSELVAMAKKSRADA